MKSLNCLLAFCLMSIVHLGAQPMSLYIGTYTEKGSHGIYIAQFEAGKGTLRLMDSISADNPSYLALTKSGNRIYAVTENGGSKQGAVSSFQKDKGSGKWIKLNDEPVPSGGDHPCYISINSKERFVMVANYSGGSLAVMPVDQSGRLGGVVQLVQQQGSSVNPARQQSPHVHTALFTPKEKHVVIADLGTDMIKAYPFDGRRQQPLDTNSVIAIKAAPGAGPRHMTFHPRLNLFYVMEELSGKVSVHAIGKRSIVHLQSIAADTISAEPGSADIHLSKDGRFLYTSHRSTANTITVFAVDQKTGLLTMVGSQSTLGIKPRNFTIDPSGKYLLAANQDSNKIVVFAIDANSGLLKPTGTSLAIPSPSCLVFAAPRQ
jgi:6-phosphogluconolactonase